MLAVCPLMHYYLIDDIEYPFIVTELWLFFFFFFFFFYFFFFFFFFFLLFFMSCLFTVPPWCIYVYIVETKINIYSLCLHHLPS